MARGFRQAGRGSFLEGLDLPIQGMAFENSYIGSGGFTGEANLPLQGKPHTGALFGMNFTLTEVQIGFRQNVPTASEIKGSITLPFFEKPVDVEIGINLDGGFTVKLTDNSGIEKITKDGLLEVELESLGFELADGVFTATMSGNITPLFGAPVLDWPTFKINELVIDSAGNVHLEGGWLNLREQYSLDFYGFQIEITKLGFGKTEDGGKWIGFSGGLKLVDGSGGRRFGRRATNRLV